MRYLMMLFLVALLFHPANKVCGNTIQGEAYSRLDKIREEKKRQLFDYWETIRQCADSVKTDDAMLNFFHIKRQYYSLQKKFPPPSSLQKNIEKLKLNIREHYLRRYLTFYDILFVDRNGDIFYTIRQQADYHKNIFNGELAKTYLARQLIENPLQTFVDYQYYSFSGEPSAFLIVPVMKDEMLTGWFIFQCAINKTNNIFAQEEYLGATGEVFLVNRENYMLTDSRFSGESSILKQHLSPQNIESKFREKTGQKIVVDYRGFRVLSSFEVCHVADCEWLLITKIDEDEIITEQYRKNRQALIPGLVKYFSKNSPACASMISVDPNAIFVDMDEFRKAKSREMLRTFGVSTCTAVIVNFPEKFSYMAHISNLDRSYGGKTTDLVSQIFKQMKNFDIYKYEIRNIQVTIIANHIESVMNIIENLLTQGVFLSQIKFMHNAKAEYADVLHNYIKNQTLVRWKMNNDIEDKHYQCDSDVESVGNIFKNILDIGDQIQN